ncbi:MAG: NAD-binding protein [Proteobacteria bacterium]|nr:NAD-binding protein [Pseudomonadota bacterium]
MVAFFRLFKQLADQLKAENLHRVLLLLVFLVLAGSWAFWVFEKRPDFFDAVWWSIVTVTTVGYGDISPVTLGGRIVGIVLMMLGIGFIGLLTATIAGIFVENKIMENRGRRAIKVDGHFVICGWNHRGSDVVAELRADSKTRNTPIVVVAEIEEKPLEDKNFHFVHGEIDAATLEQANMARAVTAIILADDTLDAGVRDAKAILNTLTVKSLYPDVYTCVELMDAKNVEHCQRARADEIIVLGELSSNLLVQAALDPGVTKIITELVSNRYGSELYKVPLPTAFSGRTFVEVLTELKKSCGVLCVGVENKQNRKLLANPDSDYRLQADDQLIVISVDRPHLG